MLDFLIFKYKLFYLFYFYFCDTWHVLGSKTKILLQMLSLTDGWLTDGPSWYTFQKLGKLLIKNETWLNNWSFRIS